MTKSIRADLRANTHALYRFYDTDGALLYVGITNDMTRRFGEHGSEKPWWSRVTNIKIQHFNSRTELANAEVVAIETEHPKYNRAHAAGLTEYVRPHTRHASPIYPDAHRFGTSPPQHHPDEPQEPRLRQMSIPCPECHGRCLTEADENWQPTYGDIWCEDCGTTWNRAEWRRAAFGL